MFEEWYLNDLISPTIQKIWKQTDYYLLKLIFNMFQKVGIYDLLKKPITISEILRKQDYSDGVYSSIEWMLERLLLDNYVTKTGEKYQLSDKEMTYNLEEVKEKAISEAPTSIAAFNMLYLMAENYPDFLSGKKTGVDIVFSPDNIDITNRYYSNNLFYNVHNIAGAKIVNWALNNYSNPKILEVGGGLGGGTKQFVIQRLKENLPLNNFEYYFTDIANKMLRLTKRGLKELTDDIDSFIFKKLNFNEDLLSQGYEENSFDIIWGVNAAHVATDLRFTLNQFKKTLKKGGSLIISETVRPVGNTMIQQEFILNTLTDYWNVKLDKEIRPRHGFLEWTDWVNALMAAGFVNVETIPDMKILDEKYDNCYVVVVKGEKG